ncbi:MAG: hypothetical protein ACE5KH_00645 [Candidatus Geothermarchaeales archaeon]
MSGVDPDNVNRVIREAVGGILGETASSVFFGVLERKHDVALSEVAKRPQDFSALLSGFFGSGAHAVERAIVLRLAEQFGAEISSKSFLAAMGELVG